MSLPNELLLDIIGFLDYNSIVPAKFVDSTFLRVITEFSESLARQRHFTLLIQNAWVTYTDGADTARRNIRYDPEIHESFAEACHRLASVTGHHIVDQVQFMDNTWNRPYILGIFAIPAVKYAPKLGLIRSSNPAFAPHAVSSAFLCQFVRLRSLYLALDPEVEAFPWNLLRSDTFRGLTCLKISPQRQNWSDTVFDEVVHYCSTLPDPSDGERLLDVSASRFPEAFIERLVNVRLSSFVLRLTVTSATLFPRTFVKQLISVRTFLHLAAAFCRFILNILDLSAVVSLNILDRFVYSDKEYPVGGRV